MEVMTRMRMVGVMRVGGRVSPGRRKPVVTDAKITKPKRYRMIHQIHFRVADEIHP